MTFSVHPIVSSIKITSFKDGLIQGNTLMIVLKESLNSIPSKNPIKLIVLDSTHLSIKPLKIYTFRTNKTFLSLLMNFNKLWKSCNWLINKYYHQNRVKLSHRIKELHKDLHKSFVHLKLHIEREIFLLEKFPILNDSIKLKESSH